MRFAVVSGVLATLIFSASARAGVVENFTVEDWGGLAYADDETGKIANCSVYAANQKGATLLFIKNVDESWFFSLTDDDWKLESSAQYPVSYKIDGRRTVEAEALALSDTQLGIYMAKNDPFFGQVRRGNRLTFTYDNENYTFELSDSGKALDAAETCLQRHKETDAQTAAASDAPAEQPAPPAPATSSEAESPGPEPEVAEAPSEPTPAADEDNAAEAGTGEALIGAPTLPPFGNVQIEAIEVPGWQAAAFADDGGKFTHCGIRAEYENGTTLAFARTADRSLIMALAREDWTTKPGNWIPIKYTYNGGEIPIEVTGEAQAPTEGLLAVNMGKEDMLAGSLKTAPEIVVEAEGKTLTFDITDIGPGFEAIEACFQKHGAAAAMASSSKKKSSSSKKVAQAAPETAAAPEPQDAPEAGSAAQPEAAETAEAPAADASADTKVEAASFTAALLTRSGYADHTMLTGDAVPESMRDRASAWQIGEIIGVTDIVGGTVAEIRAQLEESDKKDCTGTFTHKSETELEGKGAHVFSSCKSPSLNLNIHYVILPREAEGYHLLSFIAFAEGSAVESIATEVFETARAG